MDSDDDSRDASQPGNALKSKLGAAAPNQARLLSQGVKIAFAVALTALFVYWGLAYQYDAVWFEF